MSKDKNKKTRCPKNYSFTAKEIADLVGCSVSAVKQIRLGTYANMKSPLAIRVLEIDSIGIESKSLLIKEIERVVSI